MDTAKKNRWRLGRREAGAPPETPPPAASRRPENAPIKMPPLPEAGYPVGWSDPKGGGMVEWYWDGKTWTGRRELTPAGWVVR